MADLTGAISFERFTGPQILKIATTDAEAYAKTEVSRGLKDFPLIFQLMTRAQHDRYCCSIAVTFDDFMLSFVRAGANGVVMHLPPELGRSKKIESLLSHYYFARELPLNCRTVRVHFRYNNCFFSQE